MRHFVPTLDDPAQLLLTLFEEMGEGVFVVAGDGTVLGVNRSAAEALGQTPEEVLGSRVWDFAVDLSPQEAAAIISRFKAGERPLVASRHRRKDGTTYPVRVRFLATLSAPPGMVLLVEDRSEAVGREHERNLATALAEVGKCFLETGSLVAMARRVVKEATAITGASDAGVIVVEDGRAELLAVSEMHFEQPASSLYREAQAAIAAHGHYAFPLADNLLLAAFRQCKPVCTNDPRTHPAWAGRLPPGHPSIENFLGVPLQDHHGALGALVFANKPGGFSEADAREAAALADTVTMALRAARDADARRQAEKQLQRAARLEAVGLLAGGVAHDFNNLLTVIGAHADMLLQTLSEENLRHGDAAAIKVATARAADLTRQLLAVSRRQVLEPEIVEPAAIVTGLEGLLRRTLGEEILLVLAFDFGGVVRVDPGQLEQVLLNLCINARDAMPRGGELCVSLSRRSKLPDEVEAIEVSAASFLCLEVRDSGTGMDPSTLDRIFEPFFTTKGEERGTGLGLAQVRGIVRQSGGTLGVESVLGEGSVFKIFLPETRRGDAPARQAQPSPSASPRGGDETLLLIDDDPLVRRAIGRALRRVGYTVFDAESGEQGLEQAAAHPEIALLVTDVVMPGLTGPEVAERYRQLRPAGRVLYVTGHVDPGRVAPDFLRPRLPLLRKPFGLDALLDKVRQILDR